MVDGEEPPLRKERESLVRDGLPKQITIEKDGYKSEYKAVYQFQRPWYHIFSWIPFGILYIPILIDHSNLAYDYPYDIILEEKLLKISERGENEREVFLYDIEISASNDDKVGGLIFRSYRRYLNKRARPLSYSYFPDFRYTDTELIENSLNEVLVEGGFIDTTVTSTIFRFSYANNLILSADIQKVQHSMVQTHFSLVDLKANWELKNIYGETVFSFTTETKSGEFVVPRRYFGIYTERNPSFIYPANFAEERIKATQVSVYLAMIDAMEKGLIQFMENDEVRSLISDRSFIKKEQEAEFIILKPSDSSPDRLSEAIEGVVLIKTEERQGSGFFISEEGYLITNYNRIANADEIEVVVSDGSSHEAQLVRKSKLYDLALLKINAESIDFRPLSFNKSIPDIGSNIFVVGSPLSEELAQSVSRGIVSAFRESPDGLQYIQTDASINSGNNGGPLTDENGGVLGIVLGSIRSLTIDGIGFALPTQQILEKLKIEFQDEL